MVEVGVQRKQSTYIRRPDLRNPSFKAYPYQFYKRLRHEAPVYELGTLAGVPTVLVTRYDDVVSVLKDSRLYKSQLKFMEESKAYWIPKFLQPIMTNMLDSDPPNHTRLRNLVQQGFTPRRVEDLRARIERLCHELLDKVQKQGRFDLMNAYALPVPMTIISEMFGVPPQDHAKFHRWSSRIVNIINIPEMLKALPSLWFFMRYMRNLIEQRRKNPQDDLISALIQAQEAGDKLSEDELIAMIVLLLIAGHETTVNLIGSGTLALLQDPEQLRLLKSHPELLGSAVEELLRFTSPVDIATQRYVGDSFEIHGYRLDHGTQVLGVLGSANRDETVFEYPDQLNIERKPNKHLALGQGIHYCLGAPLARLEGQVAFQVLFERMPHLRLTTYPDALRWRKNMFLRGLERLPVQA